MAFPAFFRALYDPVPQSCSNIRTLLHNTPSIPDSSSIIETVDDTTLFLEGHSQWKIDSPASCDLPSTKRSRPQQVQVGVANPAFGRVSNEFLPDWAGFEALPETRPVGNYLCAFILGWSYILSARLLELRRKTDNDKILYIDQQATLHGSDQALSHNHFLIPIGNADPAECWLSDSLVEPLFQSNWCLL